MNILAWFAGFFSLSLLPASEPALEIAVSRASLMNNPSAQTFLSQKDVLGADFSADVLHLRIKTSELATLSQLGVTYEIESSNSHNISANFALPYLTPAGVATKLSQLAQKYPKLARVVEIGRSVENRPILALEIKSQSGDADRPTAFFNGMLHARELMTTETLVHMAETLLSQYGTDSETTTWINTFQIVIVPQANPDGNQIVHNGYPWWRKNTAGNAVMYGVDLNRNFPSYWNACKGSSSIKSDDTYRGPTSASEPETKAMIAAFEKYRPVVNVSYHAYAEVILYPYGCDGVVNPSKEIFREIATEMKNAITDDQGNIGTYRVGTPPELLYSADGADNDTHWQKFGTFSFTIEMNSARLGFQPNFEQWRNLSVQRQEGGWKAILRRLQKNTLRARIVSDDVSQVTYQLKKKSVFGTTIDFAEPSVSEFRLRNQSGLLFQLINPGESYDLILKVRGKVTKILSVSTSEGAQDLRDVSLEL